LLLKDILYSLGEYDKIIKIPFKIKTQTWGKLKITCWKTGEV
jgi:hypothetical protein